MKIKVYYCFTKGGDIVGRHSILDKAFDNYNDAWNYGLNLKNSGMCNSFTVEWEN